LKRLEKVSILLWEQEVRGSNPRAPTSLRLKRIPSIRIVSNFARLAGKITPFISVHSPVRSGRPPVRRQIKYSGFNPKIPV
jgi:hypothetical protein